MENPPKQVDLADLPADGLVWQPGGGVTSSNGLGDMDLDTHPMCLDTLERMVADEGDGKAELLSPAASPTSSLSSPRDVDDHGHRLSQTWQTVGGDSVLTRDVVPFSAHRKTSLKYAAKTEPLSSTSSPATRCGSISKHGFRSRAQFESGSESTVSPTPKAVSSKPKIAGFNTPHPKITNVIQDAMRYNRTKFTAAALCCPCYRCVTPRRRKTLQDFTVKPWYTRVQLIATVVVLVAADLSVAFIDKSADTFFEAVFGLLFIFFLLDLILMSTIDRKQVYSALWWLDLLACCSIILEMRAVTSWLVGLIDDGSNQPGEDLSIVEAGKAARAGTRVGRFMRLLRVVRVARIVRLLRFAFRWRIRWRCLLRPGEKSVSAPRAARRASLLMRKTAMDGLRRLSSGYGRKQPKPPTEPVPPKRRRASSVLPYLADKKNRDILEQHATGRPSVPKIMRAASDVGGVNPPRNPSVVMAGPGSGSGGVTGQPARLPWAVAAPKDTNLAAAAASVAAAPSAPVGNTTTPNPKGIQSLAGLTSTLGEWQSANDSQPSPRHRPARRSCLPCCGVEPVAPEQASGPLGRADNLAGIGKAWEECSDDGLPQTDEDAMGVRVNAKIRQNVVIGVILIFIVVPFLEVPEVNHEWPRQLDNIEALDGTAGAATLLAKFIADYPDAVLLTVQGTVHIDDVARREGLRAIEMRIARSQSGLSEVVLDISSIRRQEAILSFIQTQLIIALLALQAVALSKDVERMLVRPVRRIGEYLKPMYGDAIQFLSDPDQSHGWNIKFGADDGEQLSTKLMMAAIESLRLKLKDEAKSAFRMRTVMGRLRRLSQQMGGVKPLFQELRRTSVVGQQKLFRPASAGTMSVASSVRDEAFAASLRDQEEEEESPADRRRRETRELMEFKQGLDARLARGVVLCAGGGGGGGGGGGAGAGAAADLSPPQRQTIVLDPIRNVEPSATAECIARPQLPRWASSRM